MENEVTCQHCQTQMEKKLRVEKDLVMQVVGVILFITALCLAFYFPLFPIGTVCGLLLMWIASKLGYEKYPIWLCPNCNSFFKRAD